MNRADLLRNGPKLRRWILLGAVFGVPTLFVRTLHDPINVPKLSLLMVCAFGALAIRLCEIAQGASTQGLRRMGVPFALVVTPLTIAWLFSPYKEWALFGDYPRFTGLLPYVVVALFGALIADAFVGGALSLAWAFAAAGGVAGGYGVLQRFGLDPFEWTFAGNADTNVVASTLGNPDFVGGFLGIMLPVVGVLWFLEPQRRAWVSTLFVLTLGGWILSFSQGGWGAGVAGLVVAGSFLVVDRWRWARAAGLVVAASIALAGVGAVVVGIVSDASTGPTSTRRADWWHGAMNMTAASPLVGRGPSSFAIEHSRYRTVDDALEANYNIEDDPHNVALAFSTAAGVIGAFGFLAFIAWGVRRGVLLENGNLIGAAFMGAFAAYATQTLVSIDTVALRSAGWCALGALVACGDIATKTPLRSRSRKKGSPEPLRRLPAVLAIVALGMVTIGWSINFSLADGRFANALGSLSKGEINRALLAYESSLRWPDELEYHRAFGRNLGSVTVSAAHSGNKEVAGQLFAETRAVFSYLADFPYATSLVEYARFLRDFGSVDPKTGLSDPAQSSYDRAAQQEALKLLERAVTLDPLNPSLLNEAADLALDLDEFETVVRILSSRAQEVDSPLIWGELALAEAHLGRSSQSREHATAALQLDPDQSHALSALELLDSRK